MRTALNLQEEIVLSSGANTHHFSIEAVIGEGATCYVYEGHDLRQGRRVRIKELYPFYAKIRRTGQELQWEDHQEKDEAVLRFENAAKKQMEFSNSAAIGNSTVHLDGVYDGNGTKYLIMAADFGTTFDKDSSTDLLDILQSIKALTSIVKRYHQAGFLHLDIKPENFLIIPETRELVKLFDTDTVVYKEDLASSGQKLFCSQKWAAPEQVLGRVSKICKATDLYAIGAILFARITGAPPLVDDMTPFADWVLDGTIFENTNPAAKPKLKEIFHKTLAASVDSRYQNAAELEVALQNVIQIAAEKQYLVSNYPAPPVNFVGRQMELCDIERRFTEGINAIFLHGFGGVGKTALALSYAKRCLDLSYDAIISMPYRDGESHLEDCISRLSIHAYTDEYPYGKKQVERRLDVLRQICKSERCLFIIDNFDTNREDQDELLEKILTLPAHFLITTRNDHSYFSHTAQLEIGTLDESSLVKIFKQNCGADLSFEEEKTVCSILHSIECNTLLSILLARQARQSGISVAELRKNIFAQQEKVRMTYGGKLYHLTVQEHLKIIWDIAALGERKQQTLINMWLLQTKRFEKGAYKELTGADSLDDLNYLIDGNWVQWDGAELSLHPLIDELVEQELNPQFSNCSALAGRFHTLLNQPKTLSQEDILTPKHILHAIAKWLSVEDTEEGRNNLFRICTEILDNMLHTGPNSDSQTVWFHCFDEGFTPEFLFAPLKEISREQVKDANRALVGMRNFYQMVSQISSVIPKTEEAKFYGAWDLYRGKLTNYLTTLRNDIKLSFLEIRLLSAHEYWMREWGMWDDYDDAEEDSKYPSPLIANYTRYKETIDYVTQRIAEYDQVIQYYYQTYFPTKEVRNSLPSQYYLDESSLIFPKDLVQWYWPVVLAWSKVLEDGAVETAITTETALLHVATYELMRHTLIQLDTILAENSFAQDSWGNYSEIADSLTDSLMNVCAYRMEQSALPDADGVAIELGLNYTPKSRKELIAFQIPAFPPPEY